SRRCSAPGWNPSRLARSGRYRRTTCSSPTRKVSLARRFCHGRPTRATPKLCRRKGNASERIRGAGPLSSRAASSRVPALGREMDLDSLSQFSLVGKRALITGSSRGIGYGIAAALASAGADVILNARDKEALGAACDRLATGGARARALAFDVTSADSVGEAVDYAEAEIGPIDILVNNAGIQFRSPLEEFPAEKFDQVIST